MEYEIANFRLEQANLTYRTACLCVCTWMVTNVCMSLDLQCKPSSNFTVTNNFFKIIH